MVTSFHIVAAKLQTRYYFEYVASDANIVDGLSRDGPSDPFAQHWHILEAALPTFDTMSAPPIDQLVAAFAN